MAQEQLQHENRNEGNCAEVAACVTVLVRDAKYATGLHLRIPATEWRSFGSTIGGRTGTPG
ncbi:DUF397 domain-containing protein [Actinokineospora xionganensis]|uniref:DUF397 domain-containing protein n=1 Tax=Actinokineospora xionganensis TaxID=2684470 RepID=UPI0035E4425F